MKSDFRLHHRWIGETSPRAVWMVLHGILGTGSNWMSFACRIVEALPDIGVALVDLRMHGDSQGAPPPHNLDSCVRDLAALAEKLPAPASVVCGHSFGSKVALAYAGSGVHLEELWLFDGDPGPSGDTAPNVADRADDVDRVLGLLDAQQEFHASRATFVADLERRGLAKPVAQWLGTQVRGEEGGYRFRPELDAIRALLGSYRSTDAWAIREALPAAKSHLVLGGRSQVVGPRSRERLVALQALHPGQFELHVLEKAGHWLHVDDLPGLLKVVLSG